MLVVPLDSRPVGLGHAHGRARVGALTEAKVFARVEDSTLMLVEGRLQLLVCVDEVLHGLVVWSGVLRRHVALDATGSALAAVGKLLDQVIVEHLGRRGVHDDLLEKFGRCASLLEAAGQLYGVGQSLVGMAPGEVVL